MPQQNTNEQLSIVERFGQADDPNLTFKADVPKLRAARKYKIVTEKLLGKYDENGKYVIEPHILAELLAMPKLLDVEDKTGKMEITAEYKDGTLFKFCATEPRRKKDQQDQSVFSVLELVEDVKLAGGYETENIKTVVGSFKTSDLINFDKNRRSAFHIFNRDDPDAKKRTPTDNIDARRTYLTLVEELEAKNFVKTEKKFYKQTLKALKKVPGGKKLLAQFKNKQDIIDNFFDKKDKSKYRAYNDMFNLIVNDPENKKIVESIEYQKNIGPIGKEYLEDMRKIDADVNSSKRLQDIKKAGELVAAVGVDEYYQSLTEDNENAFKFSPENMHNKNTELKKFDEQNVAEENKKRTKDKVKIGGKKEEDFNTLVADLTAEVKGMKEEIRQVRAEETISKIKTAETLGKEKVVKTTEGKSIEEIENEVIKNIEQERSKEPENVVRGRQATQEEKQQEKAFDLKNRQYVGQSEPVDEKPNDVFGEKPENSSASEKSFETPVENANPNETLNPSEQPGKGSSTNAKRNERQLMPIEDTEKASSSPPQNVNGLDIKYNNLTNEQTQLNH